MEYSAIITSLALFQLVFFAINTGRARGKANIKAPAMTGDPIYERTVRVHMNSLENAVVFIPALWMFNHYWDPRVGAAVGLIYIAGRFVYMRSYIADPASRGPGFGISFSSEVFLLAGALIGAVMTII
ncbi:MAG: MAPEG family protein [Gammaproteobacteria bacterium]|nr:MAPEG family protein [Gammaproteobacteria bacterium]